MPQFEQNCMPDADNAKPPTRSTLKDVTLFATLFAASFPAAYSLGYSQAKDKRAYHDHVMERLGDIREAIDAYLNKTTIEVAEGTPKHQQLEQVVLDRMMRIQEPALAILDLCANTTAQCNEITEEDGEYAAIHLSSHKGKQNANFSIHGHRISYGFEVPHTQGTASIQTDTRNRVLRLELTFIQPPRIHDVLKCRIQGKEGRNPFLNCEIEVGAGKRKKGVIQRFPIRAPKRLAELNGKAAIARKKIKQLIPR